MAPTKSLSIPQKILNATATLSKGSTKHVCRKKVAQMCGMGKQETRSCLNQIGILKNKKMHVVADKETIQLTDEGLKHADMEAPAAANDECLEANKAKIKMGKGKKVFDFLKDGKTHTCAEIGQAIGSDHTQRSFSNILGPLRTSGCIENSTKNGEKACRMKDDMFPFGRPGSNAGSGEESIGEE